MKLSSVQRFFRQNKTVKNDWLFQKNWRGYKYLILFNDSRMHILSYIIAFRGELCMRKKLC